MGLRQRHLFERIHPARTPNAHHVEGRHSSLRNRLSFRTRIIAQQLRDSSIHESRGPRRSRSKVLDVLFIRLEHRARHHSAIKASSFQGPTTLVQNDFTWTQDANGNFYIGSTQNTYNPGSSQAVSQTNQTVDVYGNVTQVQKFNFGNLTTPLRTYNYSYLNSSNYTSLYIYASSGEFVGD